MSVVAIVQARMGSTRLPGKVLADIAGSPAIDHLLARLGRAERLDKIVIATSDQPADDELAAHLEASGHTVFRGSEADVLGRYADAAAKEDASVIVRITGDCPLVDPAIVDHAIKMFGAAKADYLSNVIPPTYPDGLDVEVFSRAALDRAAAEATSAEEREHVTSYLIDGPGFTRANFELSHDLSNLRITLDEPADLALLRDVFVHFAPRDDMGWEDIVALLQSGVGLDLSNQKIPRNEGGQMGTGQKLWKRAKAVIPGGNMLLSKRAEMFAPDQWPAYFSKAKGCTIWDLDGQPLIDMGIMGVGTNTLGYGDPEVDAAVMDVVRTGNLSTLNAPEEVWLAERLVGMNPWSGMVRFARTGGEANSIAVRIGRAASGRDGVAICGYHGWHDWYLSANLAESKNLDGHLLPGLEPNGVPRELRGTTHPFLYNDFAALEGIVARGDVGVIKMEVTRNEEPKNDFLRRVRKLADDNGIVLIFDECTSGFRETFGGLHQKYDVEPDIAIYGKTIGNGYACTAIVGRENVMQAAQTTFISSTFWTERIGSAAALKTLDVMEREQSWKTITETGQKVMGRWKELATAHGLNIDVYGLPAIACYDFVSEAGHGKAYQTYLVQALLEQGYLASTCLYSSLAHTDDVLEPFFDALNPVFATIAKCERGEEDIMGILKGPVAHSGFKRLN